MNHYIIGKGTSVWVWNKKLNAYEINNKKIDYGVIKSYEP
jgi:hypothetical protein